MLVYFLVTIFFRYYKASISCPDDCYIYCVFEFLLTVFFFFLLTGWSWFWGY